MLRSVGRRGLALIEDSSSWPRVWSNLGCGGGFAADPKTTDLGLGFMGLAGQQTSRTFIGGLKALFPAAAKEVGQGLNSVLPIGRLGCGDGRVPLPLSQVRGFIQLRTNLEVADNSGARRVQCIKVMKGSNAAKIGDIIMASVKDAQPRGKVKKGEVVTCVVVRAATQKLRRDGSEIKFDKNAVVLINKQGEPIGTRIFGPVPHELRRRKLVKILTLAEYVA